jgi:hypothetical protein
MVLSPSASAEPPPLSSSQLGCVLEPRGEGLLGPCPTEVHAPLESPRWASAPMEGGGSTRKPRPAVFVLRYTATPHILTGQEPNVLVRYGPRKATRQCSSIAGCSGPHHVSKLACWSSFVNKPAQVLHLSDEGFGPRRRLLNYRFISSPGRLSGELLS